MTAPWATPAKGRRADAPTTPLLDDDVTALVRDARRVVVITGAGISAPSGLATYREGGSAWTAVDIEQMSHAKRYGNHLTPLWERLWGPLVNAAAAAQPNPAHHALTAWQTQLRATGGELRVVTQNVDGLHQRAHTSGVTEIHGTTTTVRCLRCMKTSPTPHYAGAGVPPCPQCGAGRTRPNVVLFGERLSAPAVRTTEQAIASADLFLAIGTSGVVHPVAGWLALATRSGVPTVALNTTARAGFAHIVLGDCAATLPAILDAAGA